MKALIGLGNPGPNYAETRHNVGFLFLDVIASMQTFPPFQEKFSGALTKQTIGEHPLYLFKPLQYMNRSGPPLQAFMQYYKLQPSDVCVFYDEADLLLGKIRIKQGGGNGGHNGIKSIEHSIGKDFWRCRIGIGRPSHPHQELSAYVLGKLTETEKTEYNKIFSILGENISFLIKESPQKFLQETTNSLAQSRS